MHDPNDANKRQCTSGDAKFLTPMIPSMTSMEPATAMPHFLGVKPCTADCPLPQFLWAKMLRASHKVSVTTCHMSRLQGPGLFTQLTGPVAQHGNHRLLPKKLDMFGESHLADSPRPIKDMCHFGKCLSMSLQWCHCLKSQPSLHQHQAFDTRHQAQPASTLFVYDHIVSFIHVCIHRHACFFPAPHFLGYVLIKCFVICYSTFSSLGCSVLCLVFCCFMLRF